MKRTYVKSLKEYKYPSRFEEKKILAAAKRIQGKRKRPTSIALDDDTIRELRKLAEWRGVPYQILMRMFILEGLHHSKVRDAR